MARISGNNGDRMIWGMPGHFADDEHVIKVDDRYSASITLSGDGGFLRVVTSEYPRHPGGSPVDGPARRLGTVAIARTSEIQPPIRLPLNIEAARAVMDSIAQRFAQDVIDVVARSGAPGGVIVHELTVKDEVSAASLALYSSQPNTSQQQ
jgi:hypothetical protein